MKNYSARNYECVLLRQRGMTLKELSERYEVSEERINQILKRTNKKILEICFPPKPVEEPNKIEIEIKEVLGLT